jgi:hypothetical protein
MRVLAPILIACTLIACALAGCFDYGLDSRKFTCAAASDCGAGWDCVGGFCAHGDGGGPDARPAEICGNHIDDDGNGLVDCQDPACGVASCDDANPCTDDSCNADGSCAHVNVANTTPCGTGCECRNGDPIEKICDDGIDNDGDGLIDCRDTADCPVCMGGLTCCASGTCAMTCP